MLRGMFFFSDQKLVVDSDKQMECSINLVEGLNCMTITIPVASNHHSAQPHHHQHHPTFRLQMQDTFDQEKLPPTTSTPDSPLLPIRFISFCLQWYRFKICVALPMEEHSGFWFSKLCFLVLALTGSILPNLVLGANSESDAINGLCNTDLSLFLPFPYNSLPHMVCTPLWNSYLLRYSQSKDHEITIVLSTIYTGGWVGIGFSKDGKMLNSSCMVGWMNLEGQGRIKQYHVKGYIPSEIKADEGELPLTNAQPYVAIQGATIYLAFQLKFNRILKTQPILLAFSTKTPHHHRLTHHDDKTSKSFDFSSGSMDSSVDLSPSIFKDRRTHGTLAMLAWGLFLPVGAILARYLRHKESLWYYLHIAFQFIGFLLGVSAVVVGLSLNNKMHAFIPAHKGMGIFILVLTVLQVSAFFTRPSKSSKYRRHWNWYHNWAGRICLLFGAINIVLGMHIAGAGQAWRIGYGFLIGFILFTVIVMEALHQLRRSREERLNGHPSFPVHAMEKEIPL